MQRSPPSTRQTARANAQEDLPNTSALTSLPGLGDETAREDIQALLTGYDRESDEDFNPSQRKPRRSTRKKVSRIRKRTTTNSRGLNDEQPPEHNVQGTGPVEDETQRQETQILAEEAPWQEQPLLTEHQTQNEQTILQHTPVCLAPGHNHVNQTPHNTNRRRPLRPERQPDTFSPYQAPSENGGMNEFVNELEQEDEKEPYQIHKRISPPRKEFRSPVSDISNSQFKEYLTVQRELQQGMQNALIKGLSKLRIKRDDSPSPEPTIHDPTAFVGRHASNTRQTAPAAAKPIKSREFPSLAKSDRSSYKLGRVYNPVHWKQEHLMPERLANPRISTLAEAQLGATLSFGDIEMESLYTKLTTAILVDGSLPVWKRAQRAGLAALFDIEIIEFNIWSLLEDEVPQHPAEWQRILQVQHDTARVRREVLTYLELTLNNPLYIAQDEKAASAILDLAKKYGIRGTGYKNKDSWNDNKNSAEKRRKNTWKPRPPSSKNESVNKSEDPS